MFLLYLYWVEKWRLLLEGNGLQETPLKIYLGSLLEIVNKETGEERDWKSAEDYMIHGSRFTVTDYKRCIGIRARQTHPLYAIP